MKISNWGFSLYILQIIFI